MIIILLVLLFNMYIYIYHIIIIKNVIQIKSKLIKVILKQYEQSYNYYFNVL